MLVNIILGSLQSCLINRSQVIKLWSVLEGEVGLVGGRTEDATSLLHLVLRQRLTWQFSFLIEIC